MGKVELFERYPLLGQKLPHVSLGGLPTPIVHLQKLGQVLGAERLFVKRDDLSGAAYGGNKPRKLEFILGHAVQAGAREVLTFGCAGSNHALATAIYAKQLGLGAISLLMPQPNAHYVRRNLLLSHHYGAELHLRGAGLESALNRPLMYSATLRQMLRHWLRCGRKPFPIPPGGSSVLGVVGHVNAAFELARQVAEVEMPQPDLVYVACGTLGTSAGLILGLKAAGLQTPVVSVGVTGPGYVSEDRLAGLVKRTSAYLHSLDATFPEVSLHSGDTAVRHECVGRGYAQFTREGMEAVSLMHEYEGIPLEGTYTGKTMAALIADTRNGNTRDRTILFWNTVNSKDLSDIAASVDYHALPRPFHCYFEDDVQPLDH